MNLLPRKLENERKPGSSVNKNLVDVENLYIYFFAKIPSKTNKNQLNNEKTIHNYLKTWYSYLQDT